MNGRQPLRWRCAIRRAPTLWAALGLALSLPTAALADGFIIVERPPEPVRRAHPHNPHFPLAVKSHRVTVTIKGAVAVTEVDQVFHNPNGVQLEGTYIFPLPEDAALTQFSMYMGGQEVQGEVLERARAREIYEGIVRSMKDPALLEYMGRGLFKARIFPIEANSDKRIKLSYSQVLTPDHNRCRYVYPLNTEKFSSAPLEQCSVTVSIESERAIKSLLCPSHPRSAASRADDHHARLSWEASGTRPDRDFEVLYDLSDEDLGLSLWTYKRPGEDGTFLVTISPKLALTEAELPAKDVVFVLDTSGSMAGRDYSGKRLQQACKALLACLTNLSPKDRFNVLAFSNEVRPLSRELLGANDEAMAQARTFIGDQSPRGGTALHEALSAALALKPEGSTRPFSVVFLTDGVPTIGVIEPAEIRADIVKKAQGTRVFTLGIGTEVNTRLLDSIAAETRGKPEYVLDEEDLEVKISNFYDSFAFPVLTNCELLFEGLWVKEVYPKALPDLFKGGSLHVVGRYKGQGKTQLRLRGEVNGEKVEHLFDIEVGPESQELDFLPGRWAKQKIGFLLEQIRLNGEHKELKDEVIFLAKKYGLPTPYTSYLVVEDTAPAPERPMSPRGGRPGEPRGDDGRPRVGGDSEDAPGQAAPVPAAPVPAAPVPAAPEPASPADEAFQELERRRQKDRSEAKEGAAPFASGLKGDAGTGRANVELSKALERLKKGIGDGTDDLDSDAVRQVMRKVGAKTFYRVGELWIDGDLADIAKAREGATKLEYLSAAYFEAIASAPELGKACAIAPQVLVRLGETVYEVVLPPQAGE